MPYEKIGNNEPVCIADEVPFEIPDSWEWVRFSHISSVITKGTTPRGGNVAYLTEGIGFLRAENVAGLNKIDKTDMKYIDEKTHNGYLKRSILEENDILITIAGTLGRTAIVNSEDLPLNVNQAVSIVRLIDNTLINLNYLIFAINSPLIQQMMTKQKKITAIPNLTLEIIADCFVPIPPLKEQDLIVKEIEKYLPLLSQYEEKETEIIELNLSFPKQLKKSILQEAVQGKLVPQDENDEPASVLLDRIRAEKDALIKSGKIKKDKNKSIIFRRDNSHYEQRGSAEVCIDDELPFEIPESWELIRLNDIGIYRKGPFGSSLTKGMFVPKSENSVKVYEQKNAIKKDHTLGNYYITRKYYEEKMQGFAVSPGDIIVSCAGTIGETYVLPDDIEEGIINQALMRMTIFAPIDIEYFLLYFDYVLKQSAIESSKGSAIKNIPPFEIFKKLLLPLPPIQEQRRIVEKIVEINKYCDTL